MGNRQNQAVAQPMEEIPQQNQHLINQNAPQRQHPVYNNQEIINQSFQNQNSSVTKATTVKNNFNLKKDTLISQRQNNLLQLSFTFDSNLECQITVYVMVQEVFKDSITDYFKTDLNKWPQSQQFQFPKGISQKFAFSLFSLDLTQIQPAQLTKYQENRNLFPLVIEIRSLSQVTSEFQSYAQITYAAFNHDFSIRVLRQKILIGQRSFELHEIFGIEQKQNTSQDQQVQEEGIGKECVICYSEFKDTAVMPCRHMCLCGGCANIVRSQPNPKCPICRTPVESLLQIKIDGMHLRQG